jgi:hypothetical protein
MKTLTLRQAIMLTVCLSLMALPIMVQAQAGHADVGPPPIAPPLIREGTLAVKLVSVLSIGTTDDEIEAENQLSVVGILPRNGWIADYPVTPDIAGELRSAISDAADAGRLSISKDAALRGFDDALNESGLSIAPYPAEGAARAYTSAPSDAENYPNPAALNDYYYQQGPPVITCYAPPPDFYYLYAWVPYPFWWTGFWYPGFFVLHDFHRSIIVNRRAVFVSNHFNNIEKHKVFRIDPVARFHGKTFAGIGVARKKDFLSTGVPGSDKRIFNGPHTRNVPGGPAVSTPSRGGGTMNPQPGGGRSMTPPPRSGAQINPPSGSGKQAGPAPQGVPRVAPTPRSGIQTSPSSRGGETEHPSAGGERSGAPSHESEDSSRKGFRR